MEFAGRKDVSMLIPVVFLILPTVVVIALFPGFRSLHLFIN
jgi:tight adherence protein C